MIGCAFPLALRWPLPIPVLLIVITGILSLWVVIYNRFGNWSVFPQPKEHSQLIMKGPYRFMRHPMYTAVILGGFSCVAHNQTLQSTVSLLTLIVILNIKARYEEKLLRFHFSDYSAYQSATPNRFIPKWF